MVITIMVIIIMVIIIMVIIIIVITITRQRWSGHQCHGNCNNNIVITIINSSFSQTRTDTAIIMIVIQSDA